MRVRENYDRGHETKNLKLCSLMSNRRVALWTNSADSESSTLAFVKGDTLEFNACSITFIVWTWLCPVKPNNKGMAKAIVSITRRRSDL